MKSRITIDVDSNNQPIIKIEYEHSEDVRDKLVKRFLEGFEDASTFANFYVFSSTEGKTSSYIRPIGKKKAKELDSIFYVIEEEEIPKQ